MSNLGLSQKAPMTTNKIVIARLWPLKKLIISRRLLVGTAIIDFAQNEPSFQSF